MVSGRSDPAHSLFTAAVRVLVLVMAWVACGQKQGAPPACIRLPVPVVPCTHRVCHTHPMWLTLGDGWVPMPCLVRRGGEWFQGNEQTREYRESAETPSMLGDTPARATLLSPQVDSPLRAAVTHAAAPHTGNRRAQGAPKVSRPSRAATAVVPAPPAPWQRRRTRGFAAALTGETRSATWSLRACVR